MSARSTGLTIINENPELVTHKDAVKFIQQIVAELDHGFGFVPFIGSGFSAPSGVPLIEDIHAYLQRCIYLTLVTPNPGDRTWEPRRDRWPPFSAREKIETTDWFSELLKHHESLKDTQGAKNDRRITQEALGAMAEWRSALLFLSRLVRYPESGKLALVSPRQDVIDECLRIAVEGKHPSLEHRMLASLAGALRLDVLLTTNFDIMLERAFAQARNPLQVHDVAIGASLPDWKAVSGRRSLIKLHGTASGLRADFTLDQRPTELDRDHFAQYLTAATLDPDIKSDIRLPTKSHLLVMGYSASEQRIRDFIEHAWTKLDSNLKVFWICHSRHDVETVCAFTRAFAVRSPRGEADWCGSIILRYNYVGLLLLQLYQHIRDTLPPFGCIFPSVSRLSVPPLAKGLEPTKENTDTGRKITKLFTQSKHESSRLIVITTEPPATGLTSFSSAIYRDLESAFSCIWIDMNDICNTDGFFETLLEAAYAKVGVEHWTPVYMSRDARKRVEEFARVTRMTNKRWVIFVNARETPGANAIAEPAAPISGGHGWLDSDKDCVEFSGLLEELCQSSKPESSHIAVVLIARERDAQLIRKLRQGPLSETEIIPITLNSQSIGARVDALFERTIDEDFLLTLALLQRPRFYSFKHWYEQYRLQNSPPENVPGLRKRLEDTLIALEECDVAKWKPGGFFWLHSQARQFIRNRMTEATKHEEIHRSLAVWYRRVLDASPTPSSVFEIVYHLCQAAKTSQDRGVAEETLREASSLLASSSWMIQTHGYSKGSCRKLEETRLLASKIHSDSSASATLQIVCTEIMRAIAREVGEDGTAYRRAREVRSLLTGKAPGDPVNTTQLKNILEEGEAQGALKWIRWWRWNGMLGMASRSLHLSERSFVRALQGFYPSEQHTPDEELITNLSGDQWTQWGRPIDDPSEKELFRIEALRVLEQFLELTMLQLSLSNRLTLVNPSEQSETDLNETRGRRPASPGAIIRRATCLIAVGKEIAKKALATTASTGGRHSVRAAWCLSRILTHQSALANAPGETGSQTAMRLLSEAEGCYRLADQSRLHADLAIIELHRADAKLRETSLITITDEQKFGTWSANWTERGKIPTIDPRTLRCIRATIAEASRFLDRAESVLRERRRNVWWTGWFFERRLRVISLEIAVAELEGFIGLLPYLGLTAAPGESPTVPDMILSNTIRMTRVDAYRLATVVDSYASCAFALKRYREVKSKLQHVGWHEDRLFARQATMRENLKNGTRQLKDIFKRRNLFDPSELSPSESAVTPDYLAMDPSVIQYITAIIRRCEEALEKY